MSTVPKKRGSLKRSPAPDHTSFASAHRLSTIRDADQVIVIRDGALVEQGTPRQLLKAKGFFQHLYMSQFKSVASWEPELSVTRIILKTLVDHACEYILKIAVCPKKRILKP